MGKGKAIMGYSTDFSGRFELDRPLTPEHKAYLLAFNRTRRMKRDSTKTAFIADAVREAAGLPNGMDGAYFVGSQADFGQEKTPDVVDYNSPPAGQPGLWCQWTPTDDGTAIEWDGGEKFYDYVAWIEYLVSHFLAPWGYNVNGTVEWEGESRGDVGRIVVADNLVTTQKGKITYA